MKRSAVATELTLRRATIRPETVDETARSVEAVLATGNRVTAFDPVLGEPIDEVLIVRGVDLPDSLVLLDNHDSKSNDSVVGTADRLRVENEQVVGRLVFAEGDPVADRIWNKVRQRHLRHVSVGYRSGRSVDLRPGETRTVEGKTYTAGPLRLRVSLTWRPGEVSVVPRGADPDATIRRQAGATNERGLTMNEELRKYLESVGLSSDSTEEQAREYHRGLTGDERRRADELAAAGETRRSEGDTQTQPQGAAAGGANGNSTTNQPMPEPQRQQQANQDTVPTPEAIAQRAVVQERERVHRIQGLAVPDITPGDLVQRAISEGWDTERASAAFLQHMRDNRPEPSSGPGIHSRSHEADATLDVLSAALMVREGVAVDVRMRRGMEGTPEWLLTEVNDPRRQRIMDTAHRYSDMSLVDMCREALRLDGQRVPHNRDEMIRAAVSGSNLTAIFTTNFSAELLAAYMEAIDTSRLWTAEGDVPTFHPHEFAAMGKFGSLHKHARGRTAEHMDIDDSVETGRIARYTGQFVVDEQDIIDDRFGGLESESPREIGNSAAALRPDLVYSILLANPDLADGTALFATARGNAATDTFDAAALQDGVSAMRKMRIRERPLNVRPRFVIGPHDLEFTFKTVLQSAERKEDSGQGNLNPVRDLGITPINDDRLGVAGVIDPSTGISHTGSATTWFLAARAGEGGARTIRVLYRRGTGRAPQIRSFTLDKGAWGIGWDVKHDIGALPLDFRGLQRRNT